MLTLANPRIGEKLSDFGSKTDQSRTSAASNGCKPITAAGAAFAGDGMEQTAALRAQWLAELAKAIESAQNLAWRLAGQECDSAVARTLYGRLEALRLELESIDAFVAFGIHNDEPEWLHEFGWVAAAESPPGWTQPA